MIHLNSLIQDLGRLIFNNGALEDIESKNNEIITACDRLIDEHGEGSDIGKLLINIHYGARKIRDYLKKGFNYSLAQNTVEYMKGRIRRIGDILKIEFEETQK